MPFTSRNVALNGYEEEHERKWKTSHLFLMTGDVFIVASYSRDYVDKKEHLLRYSIPFFICDIIIAKKVSSFIDKNQNKYVANNIEDRNFPLWIPQKKKLKFAYKEKCRE